MGIWTFLSLFFYPALTGSKTPTSKCGCKAKELGGGDQLPVKARLVKANNRWGMNKTPTD
ncbi:hypothetical protein EXW51_08540 [Bacillus mycoides]|nr:hypothetical protein EXW51_08540 [Bacillus mycoides]